MKLREKQSRFLHNVGQLIVWAYDIGYEFTGGDLWARAEIRCKCPHCGGEFVQRNNDHSDVSFHYSRLAVDLNLFRNGRYLTTTEDHAPLGHYYESLDPNASWGGRWNDGNHYSYGEGRK